MGQFDIVKQFNYLLFELLKILENVASYMDYIFIFYSFIYFLSLTEWTWNIEDQAIK